MQAELLRPSETDRTQLAYFCEVCSALQLRVGLCEKLMVLGSGPSMIASVPQLQARHEAGEANDEPSEQEQGLVSKWRHKERLKTTAVALVLCLNIGVDPPDVIKISPCARLECWVDPMSMQPPKALDTIGKHHNESPVLPALQASMSLLLLRAVQGWFNYETFKT